MYIIFSFLGPKIILGYMLVVDLNLTGGYRQIMKWIKWVLFETLVLEIN